MTRELFTDVDMNHPWVSQYRLPVLPRYESMSRYSGYILSVVVPDKNDGSNELFNIGTPTDEDAAILGSYLNYRIERLGYRAGYLERMREKPLDFDSSINTVSIIKRQDGSWAYHKVTWEHPPKPFFNDPYVPKTVMELLDYIEKEIGGEGINANWAAWKQSHNLG